MSRRPGEIKIDHRNGYFTIYLHLSASRVVVGDEVSTTTLMGTLQFCRARIAEFNGHRQGWAGPDWDYVLVFTIESNILTSVSCDGSADHSFQPRHRRLKASSLTP
jgi:hypothetical protein